MSKSTKSTKTFEEFTNLYELSKTLRFELKPVGETQQMLLNNEVFEKDQTIDEAYHQAKFYFDKLHQRFIQESLRDVQLDFSNYEELFLEKKKLQKQKGDLKKQDGESNEDLKKRKAKFNKLIQDKTKKLTVEADNLRKYLAGGKIDKKNIEGTFNKTGEKWKEDYQKKIEFGKSDLKQKGYNFILSAGILKILKDEFPKEKETEFQKLGYPSLFVAEKEKPCEKIYIFDKFDGFTGYLTKFQETRKNMYSEKANGTAIANRVINENLLLFLENKIHFEKLEKENIDFSEKIKVDLKGKKLGDVFSLKFYNDCLLQNDINFYNKVIGGDVKELKNGEKESLKGLNQIINEHKQKHKDDKDFKKSKFFLFKSLHKQILGEVEKEKQLIVVDDEGKDNLFERLQEFISENQIKLKESKGLFDKFIDDEFDNELDKIYLSGKAINTISRKWFKNSYDFEILLPQKTKKKDEKDIVKLKDFVSLFEIKEVLNEQIGSKEIYKKEYDKNISDKKDNFENFLIIWKQELENLFVDDVNEETKKVIRIGYKTALVNVKNLNNDFDRKKTENIEIIKNYADASLKIFQMMKYFALEKGKKKNPENLETGDFYVSFNEYYEDYQIIKYYNAFRNFLTQRPYNENKIKLNFGKGTLLKGFSKQYSSYLFAKGNYFYLGLLKSGEIKDDIDIKNKSEYLYFPASQLKFQNIVNSGFKGSGYKYSEESNEKKAIRDAQTYIKERHLKKYPQLKFAIDNVFNTKKAFREKINNKLLEIYSSNSFIPLDSSQVEKKYNDGELYLFQIKNQDWNKDNKNDCSKNLHTLYFEQLFDKNNLKDTVYKISGGSEIFFRKKSIKKEEQQDITTQETEEKGRVSLSQELKKKYNKEVKHLQRYSEDKYFLHLSTVWNYGKQKIDERTKKWYPIQFNQETNQKLLKDLENINIIGIDRGEKHLAYYSVVNQRQEIIDQGSFNVINGHDYHQKLDEKEKERMEARKSWQSIGNIKELKNGYISQVVRRIVDLIIEHNAVVIFEDLNFGFKQGRQKIEKQVYQKLEKALIDKLNFLVNKGEKNSEEAGHLLRAYQLTAPLTTFKEMEKQTGIVFYTTANYTSTTDPLTGWRKNIYINNSMPIDKSKKGNGKYIKEELRKFKVIKWDEKKQSYFFEYDQKDFGKTEISKNWRIYADVNRLRGVKNDLGYWEIKLVNPNDLLIGLFQKFGFNLKEDIKKQIENKEKNEELKENKEFGGETRNFYKSLVFCLNLILQIRNSSSAKWTEDEDGKIKKFGKDADFIQSPIKPFFTTKCEDYEVKENFAGFKNRIIGDKNFTEDERMKQKKRILKEFNGDANGAYNIARKGVILLTKKLPEWQKENQKLKKEGKKEKFNPDLFISNTEWDKFTQKS